MKVKAKQPANFAAKFFFFHTRSGKKCTLKKKLHSDKRAVHLARKTLELVTVHGRDVDDKWM